MVDSSIMLTKYVSEWATNLRAISLSVGVTNFGPPYSISKVEGDQIKFSEEKIINFVSLLSSSENQSNCSINVARC